MSPELPPGTVDADAPTSPAPPTKIIASTASAVATSRCIQLGDSRAGRVFSVAAWSAAARKARRDSCWAAIVGWVASFGSAAAVSRNGRNASASSG